MNQRVVITGLGVVAPNGNGLSAFEAALRKGESGIRAVDALAEHQFACQVAGIPQGIDTLKATYLGEAQRLAMEDSMVFAAIAGRDCWLDAGLPDDHERVDWDTGAIIGTGISGMDVIASKIVPMVNASKIRRLGSTVVEQVMASAASAFIGGYLGLGGQVTTNSSACTTGTEAVVEGFYKIKEGRAKRMLVGGTEGVSKYSWAGFDAMRVLARGYNDTPTEASRPMSASAAGFVPAGGCGLLMLESLESAMARGARIYAEVIGASVNCGGQRNGGSITFPNPEGVKRCIQQTVAMANIASTDIDLINGHLTATMADPHEIKNWQQALALPPEQMPAINATKSMLGHGLGAAGGMECVASVLQLYRNFMHPSINCDDLHPELAPFEPAIVRRLIERELKVVAKASFGFGDVNGCVIFRSFR